MKNPFYQTLYGLRIEPKKIFMFFLLKFSNKLGVEREALALPAEPNPELHSTPYGRGSYV